MAAAASAVILASGALRAQTRETSAAPAPVRVERGSITLPTSMEGPPDVNPPFDLFVTTRFTYPYTLRQQLLDERVPQVWRTLVLENEYLKCTVLPDLGGHLYTCIDKVNGQSLFYANPSIKKANVAYRGAWAAVGVEFNFPVSHSWVTVSPVDFDIARHADGSASIFIGDVDRVYGGQWQVELRLRPGRAVLEQHTTLYNRGERRHRFYWWTNAGVRVWDDSRMWYPQTLGASHGFTDVDTWPINQRGVDLSVFGNHVDGFVSLFSHGSREPFMGVYHPRTGAGVVHYSSGADLPAKKLWSWGADADGRDWRRALSDDESAYVEIQAGLFRNQETYAFLEPQATMRFSEFWMPVRAIGGITRATREAVLHLERDARTGALRVGLQVVRDVSGARLTIACGDQRVADERGDFRARTPWLRAIERPPAAPCQVQLNDGAERPLLVHLEGTYDTAPLDSVAIGRQEVATPPEPDARTDGDWLEVGTRQELTGKKLAAWDTYARALQKYPESVALHKAAGRLGAVLARHRDAIGHLSAALAHHTNDPELHYYLGLARLGTGDRRGATEHFQLAQQFETYRTAARFELAKLAAHEGRHEEALAGVASQVRDAPAASRVGAAEVILLRRLGRVREARTRVKHWRSIDPLNAALRLEEVRLAATDSTRLWSQLAADADDVIGLALEYMALGFYDDAVEVLDRRYPEAGIVAEPGVPHPNRHPLVSYYRGYCRKRLGQAPAADYDRAAALSTAYVFPHRPDTQLVLDEVLRDRPHDTTARFLRASMFMAAGDAEAAAREWEIVRQTRPDIPVLHRNLGLALLHGLRDVERAATVLAEGLRYDPDNLDLYVGFDQALSLKGASPEERVRGLRRYPRPQTAPTELIVKLALALTEADRVDEAEQLFKGRFFPREEFGTNIRQVYLEVKLRQAQRAAASDRCPEALALVERMTTPAPELTFTTDGLEPFVRGARFQYELAQVAAGCGDNVRAARHLEAAAASAGAFPFVNFAFAHRAARELGTSAGWAPRIDDALRDARTRADVIGTNTPGTLALGRGLLLLEVDRRSEARAQLDEALRSPDRLLSHHLARQALARLESR